MRAIGIRVGYLLELLGVDLDVALNFQNHTARQEGLSMMLQIHYSNFRPYSIPNSLPTAPRRSAAYPTARA